MWTVYFSGELTLPPGHPFLNVVPSAFYWSAATNANFPTNAWFVQFDDGSVDTLIKANISGRVWCVRGGMNADAY